MKKVEYKEEGVATAVGTIFAILVFVFLISIFVTEYVPASMTSFEEEYASEVTNSMMQLISTINLLALNYQQGESSSVTFYLSSSYVPIFSSPTIGILNMSRSSLGQYGSIILNNSTNQVSAGGSLAVVTGNRYFVDEAFVFQFSSLFYEQYGTSPLVNTSLDYGLMSAGVPGNGTVSLSATLINLVGGPFTVSNPSPILLTEKILSKAVYFLNGTVVVRAQSPLASTLFSETQASLSDYPGLSLSTIPLGNNELGLKLASLSGFSQLSIHVTEITIFLSIG